MDTLKSLKNLISRISKEELNFFIKSLGETNDSSKSKKVFELILSDENFTSNEIQKFIYGKQNYLAFNKLLNRSKSRLLDSLIIDANLNRNGNYSKRNLENLRLRKELMQADILQLKGERNEVESLYKKIIKRSQENEMYDIEMQARYSLQRLMFSTSNIKKSKFFRDEIVAAENKWILLNQSQIAYNNIINTISISSTSLRYKDDLDSVINQLRINFEITNSSLIRYYLLILLAERHQNNRQYEEASNCFEEIEKLINKQSIFTLNRLGSLKINIANNCLFLNDPGKCIEYSNECLEIYKNIPGTLSIVLEILFYANFYQSDYSSCISILDKILSNKINQIGAMNSKVSYYKSCVYFAKKDFTGCFNLLMETKDLTKDVEGFNLNIRIMKILSLIESNKIEELELELQNLQQFIKRNRKFIRKRYLLISRILNSILITNFNYNQVRLKMKKSIEQLQSSNNDTRWLVRSPEIINFSSWLAKKLN